MAKKKKDEDYIEGMEGKKSNDSVGLSKKIIEEINEKVQDYENNMSGFLSNVEEWGDMFRVKMPAQRNKKAFSNPRLTEFFRAVNTVGTMSYRMMTAQDPFFEIRPMSLLAYDGQLLRLEATLETQIRESKYKQNLLKACMGLAAFGTQFVEERYKIIGINAFGRRLPITTFTPRSLLQVCFERGTSDIADADWISTSDLVSESSLQTLADDSPKIGQHWESRVIENAIADDSGLNSLSPFIRARMTANRYDGTDKTHSNRELLMYYGKLNAIGDNVEYCCALVNRRYLVKFYANHNQSGKRDMRVAHWVEDPLSLDPIALGIGAIGGKLHKSMDANRQRGQDGVAMTSYNMWGRLRSAGINDEQMKIRPLQTVDMDERNGLFPLLTNTQGQEGAFKLEDILRNEFMAASGATPTLQAIVTEGTATETTLAQNEGLRNISVKAEIAAEQLVREHILVCHSNNVQYIKEPINVNKAGFAGKVYPADLKIDIDVEVKITTDKDYKPQRLTQLKELLGLVLSTKSMHPGLAAMDVVPLIKAIAKGLDINPDDLFPNGNQPDPAMLQAMMQARGGAQGAGMPPMGAEGGEGVALSPAENVVSTPMGGVLGSPGGI